MKELNKEISTALEIYFDKKIKNARLSNELEDKIWDMVNDLIEDVEDIIRETDRDIDYAIEEEEAEYNESVYEEMSKDMAIRQQELFDYDRRIYGA